MATLHQMPMEYMEQWEYLLLQIILEVDMVLSVGLIQADLFGYLEDMDMTQLALMVCLL